MLNFRRLGSLLLLLIAVKLNAISPVEIAKEGKVSLLAHSNLYIDTKKLSLKEIIEQNLLKAFHKEHFDTVKPTVNTVWVSFELANSTHEAIQKALVFSSPLLEVIELYRENNLEMPISKGIYHLNATHSTLLYHYNIELGAKSSMRYYIKLYANYVPLNFSLYLEDASLFKMEDCHRQLENILLIGIVLALILYSFILYFYTHDKSYLFYSLYLFMIVYQQFSYLGLTQIYFQDFAILDIELTLFKVSGLMLASALFSISFLHIYKIKKLYQVYKIFIVIIFLEMVVMSIPSLYNIQIVLSTAILFITLNLIAGIVSYLRGEKQARLYSVGFGIIFLAYSFIILDALALVSIMNKFPNMLMYATAIEAFILLLAFADRYRILQNQKGEADRNREAIIKDEVIEKTAQLHKALESKELLLKEIHHRVKNNLQIILSIIRLQNDEVTDKSVSEKFINLENRINAIAKTYNMLMVDENLDSIDMEEYIESLVEDIEESMCLKCAIEIEIEADVTLPLNKSVYVGIIINELVTNAYKYAFSDAHGKIEIVLRKGGEAYILMVRDNGRGFIHNNRSDALGLKLITALVQEQLGGKMEMMTQGGTQYIIKFIL